MAERKHRAYDRRSASGKEEHIDASEGWHEEADEEPVRDAGGNPVDPETGDLFEQREHDEDTPEEESDLPDEVKDLYDQGHALHDPLVQEALTRVDDEHTRKFIADRFSKRYQERLERENKKLQRAREHAASTARLEKGLRTPEKLQENPPHSKRIVEFNADLIDPHTASHQELLQLAKQREKASRSGSNIKQLQRQLTKLREDSGIGPDYSVGKSSRHLPKQFSRDYHDLPLADQIRVDEEALKVARDQAFKGQMGEKPHLKENEHFDPSTGQGRLVEPLTDEQLKVRSSEEKLHQKKKDLARYKVKITKTEQALNQYKVQQDLGFSDQEKEDWDKLRDKMHLSDLSSDEAKGLTDEDRKFRAREFLSPEERLRYTQLRRKLGKNTRQYADFNPSERKQNVLDYNKLLSKKNNPEGIGLTTEEHRRLEFLTDKVLGYRLITKPGEKAETPEEKETARIEQSVEKVNPLEALRPTIQRRGEVVPEDLEYTVGKHGQENPKLRDIPKLKRDKKGKLRIDSPGWEATTKFNKEQLERKYNALRTGEASFGWGDIERGTGYSSAVPAEKARVTVGPTEDVLVRTKNWTLFPERQPDEQVQEQIRELSNRLAEKGDELSPDEKRDLQNELGVKRGGQDKFEVALDRKAQFNRDVDPKTGQFYEEGKNLKDTLRQAGLDLQVRHEGGGKKYTLWTEQGEHLNPDQIAALKETLHMNYGLKGGDKGFKALKVRKWSREKKRVPVGYNKLPKGTDQNDVVLSSRRNIYSGRFGARFGERDPVSGELLPGQRESIGVNIGPRTLQHHFTENTDAMGWGTSWRPGQTEIASAALAVPRAKRQIELAEAWKASDAGDNKKMHEFMQKYYPNDETEAEQEERKGHLTKEGAALINAGVLSAYYSHKRALPTRVVNSAYATSTRIPKVGPKLQGAVRDLGFEKSPSEGGGILKDTDWAYRRLISQKVERAKFRVTHPLTSGTIEPITGKIVPDPTVAGITNDKKLNIPSSRYRKYFIPPGTYEGRQIEKKANTIKGAFATRQHVEDILSGKKEATRLERWKALQEARTMLHDPRRLATEGGQHQLELLQQDIQKKMSGPIELKKLNEPTTIDKQPVLRFHIDKALEDLQELKTDPDAHKRLDALVRNYVKEHPNPVPERLVKTGKWGIGGAAVVGGSMLAVDKYQTYRQNKGKEVNHPFLKAVVPERIAVPNISVKRTKQYTLPHNALTDALDFEGEKVPIEGRISVSKQEKVRLRNHRDISGEPYKENLPLFGGVGVRAPAKIRGSLKDSVVHPTSQANLGPTKNMYVLGKKVPVDFSVGKKERWDNKRHRLRAKYNPWKLSQKDREHLVQLSAHGTPAQEEQIATYYYNDPKLQDMLEDKTERDRVIQKNIGWGIEKRNKATIADVTERAIGQTSPDYARSRSSFLEGKKEEQRARQRHARS